MTTVRTSGRPGAALGWERPTGRRGHQGGPTTADLDTTRFSALLWTVGAVLGIAGCLLPHGPDVELAGWWVLSALAAAMAALTWWAGTALPTSVQYGQAAGACTAVSVALWCAHHSPAIYAVAALYVLTTIFASSFFESRLFALYLVAQAAVSGALLLTSRLPAAPAAWVVTMGTGSAAGIAVHSLRRRLSNAAATDPLTGLPNRRAMERIVVRELARANRRHEPLSLAVIDLDEFKEVNDRLGHAAGDRVLVEVTACWQSQLRPGDVLGRFGGDEFVAILPGASAAQASAVIDRWRRSCPQPFSAGVAAMGPATPIDELLHRADDACYRAKRGRSGTLVAEPLGSPVTAMARPPAPHRPGSPGAPGGVPAGGGGVTLGSHAGLRTRPRNVRSPARSR